MRPPQVNFQADPEFIEDLHIVARRRGQTLSEFIRRTLEAELAGEATRQVP
jgi:hypothetical protein